MVVVVYGESDYGDVVVVVVYGESDYRDVLVVVVYGESDYKDVVGAHDYSPGGAAKNVRTILPCGNFSNHISQTFLNHSSH